MKDKLTLHVEDILEAFDKGYKEGLHWPDQRFHPEGPFKEKAKNNAYLQGWNKGFSKKLLQVKVNPQPIIEQFDEGFADGLYWPDAWEKDGKPGGPFVIFDNPQSVAENKAWLQGWQIGFDLKKAEGRSNPRPTSEQIREFNERHRVR